MYIDRYITWYLFIVLYYYFFRSITISLDTKNILDDNNISSNIEYLAKRLNTTLDVVDEMCVKIPYLRYIRVTKVSLN